MPRACSFQRHLFPISTPEKVAWGYRGGGGVGAWGDGGARCSSSAGPHTLEAALYLCSSERKEGRGMETACDKGSFLKTHRV